MAEPRDDDYNPYKAQTQANTGTDWLHDEGTKALDADLDGMADYAKNMGVLRDNLEHHLSYLNLLGTIPSQAWKPGSLPEGAYTSQLMLQNFNELQQYLQFLWQGLTNVGGAAQTIAIAYSGTDGWSAASLNSVDFAFGDTSKRPSGYPEAWMDQVKTYQQMYDENMKTGHGAASGVVVTWTDQGAYTDGAGAVHRVAISSDGVRKEIVEFTIPGSGTTVITTTITYPPNPDGATDKEKAGYSVSTEQRKSTYLTGSNSYDVRTVNYGPDGTETGSQVQSTTFDSSGDVNSTSTVNYGADGKETTGTYSGTNEDDPGQTIITTKDGKTTRVIEIGDETDGVIGIGEQPAQDAIDQLRPQ